MIVKIKPDYPPHCCIQCGVGDDRRKWYVDLQLPIDHYFNPVNDCALYLCNECWEALVIGTTKQAQQIMFGLELWNTAEFVQPTYDNDTEIEVTGGSRRTLTDAVRFESLDEGNDPDAERDDQSPPGDNKPVEQESPVLEPSKLRSFFGNADSGTT